MENQQEGNLRSMLTKAYVDYYFHKQLTALVDKAIKLAGFPLGEAAPRKRELLWECGLASEQKTLNLSVFLAYVYSIINRGFIPITLRP